MSYKQMMRCDPVGGSSYTPRASFEVSKSFDDSLSPMASLEEYQNLAPDHPLLQGRSKSRDSSMRVKNHERSKSHDSFSREEEGRPKFVNNYENVNSNSPHKSPVKSFNPSSEAVVESPSESDQVIII